MNKSNITKLINDIEWRTWQFNSFYDSEKEWHSMLRDDTESAVSLLKMYCDTIMKSESDDFKVVKECIEGIFRCSRPKNYEESRNYGRSHPMIETNPKYAAEIIIEDCDRILDEIKTYSENNGLGLTDLNEKWCKKYLYFNGYEDGVQIIYPTKIHYKGDDIVFDGKLITLFNENNDSGPGARIEEVEDFDFQNLYYFGEYKKVEFDTMPEFINSVLSTPPVGMDMESREISREGMFKAVQDYIVNSFNDHID